jgi:hypothetical protein
VQVSPETKNESPNPSAGAFPPEIYFAARSREKFSARLQAARGLNRRSFQEKSSKFLRIIMFLKFFL